METFTGPKPYPEYEANHEDGVKLNNYSSNLEWITKGENQAHAYAIGLRNAQGSNNPRAKINEEMASKIKDLLSDGNSYQSITSIMNVSYHIVRDINQGRSWRHV